MCCACSGSPVPGGWSGHPDGAGPVARACELLRLSSGSRAYHSLAGDNSLWGGAPPPLSHSHKPQANRPLSQEVFRNLFVCFNPQERHNSWFYIKRGFFTLCKHSVSHGSFGGSLLNTHASLLNKSFHASEHANPWSLDFESPFQFSTCGSGKGPRDCQAGVCAVQERAGHA